jgi:hypothetical protein
MVNSSNIIKNFIYLDDYKMYSISSQIFEGMTEFITKINSDKNVEKTEQKGRFAEGRLMADIIEKQSSHSETIYLHDYSYTLFENKLIELNKVLELNANSTEIYKQLQEHKFVKVTGNIILNDTKIIESALSSFNELGLNLTKINQGSDYGNQIDTLNKTIESTKDRNAQAKAKALLTNSKNLEKLAAENGLRLDGSYLNALKFLLNYGYDGQFEINLPIINDDEACFFSSILKREKLKENENIITKKYSRLSEREFSIFGIVTQTSSRNFDSIYDSLHPADPGMKSAVLNMINKISGLENLFTGRLENEYVLDPIAVYQEL